MYSTPDVKFNEGYRGAEYLEKTHAWYAVLHYSVQGNLYNVTWFGIPGLANG